MTCITCIYRWLEETNCVEGILYCTCYTGTRVVAYPYQQLVLWLVRNGEVTNVMSYTQRHHSNYMGMFITVADRQAAADIETQRQ